MDGLAWSKNKSNAFFLQRKDLPQIFVIGDMTLFDRFYNARISAANPGIQEIAFPEVSSHNLWFFDRITTQTVAIFRQRMLYRNRVRDASVIIKSNRLFPPDGRAAGIALEAMISR